MSLSSTSTRGVFFGTLAPEKKIDNCWFKITFTHCHQHISKQAWSFWEVIKCGAMPPWEKKIKTPSPSPSFPLPPSWCSFPLYAPSFHLSKWENYHMKANKKNARLTSFVLLDGWDGTDVTWRRKRVTEVGRKRVTEVGVVHVRG